MESRQVRGRKQASGRPNAPHRGSVGIANLGKPYDTQRKSRRSEFSIVRETRRDRKAAFFSAKWQGCDAMGER